MKADHGMFKIKICGITSLADANLAKRAGADAIGLNFYAPSPRCIGVDTAKEIVRANLSGCRFPASVVGVFVNASAEQVTATAREVGLDYVQIHGDEPPEYLAELDGLKVIRAFRCRDDGLDPVEGYLSRCPIKLSAALIDAYSPDAYGGTGEVVDWSMLASYQGTIEGLPLILAGGLHAENVYSAIETACPAAVDTASGVESSAGVKDAAMTEAFVAEARRGFEGTDLHR